MKNPNNLSINWKYPLYSNLVRLFIIMFLIVGIFCSIIRSQTRTFYEHGHKIQHFTVKDGLPSSHVGGIVQDQKGYLWFSTAGGFFRFDGYNFESMKIDEELITYTLKDHLNEIMESSAGNLFISTIGGGIFKFNPQSQTFKQFKSGDFYSDCSSKMVQGRSGSIWASTQTGLYEITPDDSLRIYKMKSIDQPLMTLLNNLKNEGISTIENILIDDGQTKRVEFELEQKSQISIICASRIQKDYELLDYGWIENKNGQKVWEANITKGINAGGSSVLNRLNYDSITLESGNYSLVYSKSEQALEDYYLQYIGLSEDYFPQLPTFQGIQIFIKKQAVHEKFQEIVEEYEQSLGLPDDLNYQLYNDGDSAIWWSSDYHFGELGTQSTQRKIITYCSFFNMKQPCPCKISAVSRKDVNNLWIGGLKKNKDGTESTYFGIYNIETNYFKEIPLNQPNLSSAISGLSTDKKGNLWIGTEENGLYKLMTPLPSFKDTIQPNFIKFKFNLDDVLLGTPEEIFIQIIDNNDNLWIGTRQSGIYKIDLKKLDLQFTNLIDRISDGSFMNMVEDTQGDIWIGSSTKGLLQIKANSREKILHQGTFKGVTIDSLVAPILVLPNKNILIGSKKYLFEYNSTTEEIVKKIPYPFQNYYPMIIGGFSINDSLVYFPHKHILNINDWKTFKQFDDLLGGLGIMQGIKSKQEGFWLAPSYGNVYKFLLNDNEIDTIVSFDSQVWISGAVEDLQGNCWTTSSYGLQEFNIKTGERTTYVKDNNQLLDLMGSMQLDKSGNIWIFPVSGIVKFNMNDKKLQKIHKFKEVDAGGSLYSYSYKNEKGDIHVLGSKSLYTFNPDSLTIDSIPPLVNIISLQYQKEEGKTHTTNTPLSNSISLNYYQNDLMLRYVGINFNNSSLTTYAYQLENHQKDWQYVNEERIVRFSNLPSGEYTFKVKAANADSVWSEPKELKIIIHPPWWKTWWAYLLYTFAIVGSILWYIRTLNNRLVKEQAHNKELTDLNTANQRFVPKDFLQILGKQSIKDLHLGDQTQTQMTILFSDIRSYTTMSEKMTPQQNFNFINAYLGRVGPIIKQHGGFISQYMGDGFMALFVEHPVNAIQAAIAMQKELEVYNRERSTAGRVPLQTGIGLNTGDLMLGVIGDEYRYESTVISDAVNTASRMEGLTKIFGGSIILSEKTLIGLRGNLEFPRKLNTQEEEVEEGNNLRGNNKLPRKTVDDFAYRYLGQVKVKGKDKALKIYDLYEGEPVAMRELKAQTKVTFEQGITHYFDRQFGKAAECFKQVLEVQEEDLAAQYYLDKSVGYIVDGVAEDWSGVEEMVMK